MDRSEIAVAGAQPVAGEIREQLLEPFRAAVCTALGEMAGTEVVLQAMYQQTLGQTLGDIAAVVEIKSAAEGLLLLSFPRQTATALARRILAGVTVDVDEDLIRDCVAEIANVVAGQAKAMLAETPYRFAFALPKVVVGANALGQQDLDCLVIVFSSEAGEFALQLFVKL